MVKKDTIRKIIEILEEKVGDREKSLLELASELNLVKAAEEISLFKKSKSKKELGRLV